VGFGCAESVSDRAFREGGVIFGADAALRCFGMGEEYGMILSGVLATFFFFVGVLLEELIAQNTGTGDVSALQGVN